MSRACQSLVAASLLTAWTPVLGATVESVKAAIAKVDATLEVKEVQASPVDGMYQASMGGANGYVSADGRYFIAGDMFEVATRRNLSEEQRKSARVAALAELSLADTIVFSPPKPGHTISVFTDVDCGYCRKLHTEVEKYNAQGVAVRYIAYPRDGADSSAWKTMEAVWCSKDRREALTRAKRGERIERTASCDGSTIAKQYGLGRRLGLAGTPLIVLEDGRSVGGYLPAAQIVEMLKQSEPSGAARAAR